MSTAVDQSKRSLLRGKRSAVSFPVRPPWSQTEPQFIDLCSRCGDCLPNCETGILVKGDGGFPTVDFSRGECTFCQHCVSACKTGALSASITPPWQLKAQINPLCLTHQQVVCRSCADQCETRAIRFTPVSGEVAKPLITADLCTGCGACFDVCPTRAIQLTNTTSQGDSLHAGI
ncbi:ferredoxin-type protein NapF [Aestuariirhabdus sp. Z084]|uniref:ferredoxin-type protein NapF n=1 Tax=Aestuariirhabdus haliotis TaxID=2918751 RepID=UPI00201B42FE|nr:ferredoxin-type protein NapF [Aestuariirhabdus haliotis]MCL6416073.1 ferredoxin-type protein NapF [Aestuariirhabdus haliotis]MCL6419359.1 ferredoxin-type protein NapF [Aestuariirhabdus haliotis]